MRVLGWPTRVNAVDNTYTRRLADSLRPLGVQTAEFSVFRALTADYDILHVHWPEGILKRGGRTLGLVRLIGVVSVLFAVRYLRRRQVVWTVHNLKPHGIARPRSLTLLHWALGHTVSGYILLSESGRSAVLARIPRLTAVPSAVVPIGRYSGEFVPNESRNDKRSMLNVSDEDSLAVFVGQVAEYKGATDLARVVHASTDPHLRLVIAGKAANAETRDELTELVRVDSRIQYFDGYLEAAEFANLTQAADLVVFPYREILNSASILAPLETSTRVLAPSMGAIPEMSRAVGTDWIVTYTPPLAASDISRALALQSVTDAPDLTTLEWTAVARDTFALYSASYRSRMVYKAR